MDGVSTAPPARQRLILTKRSQAAVLVTILSEKMPRGTLLQVHGARGRRPVPADGGVWGDSCGCGQTRDIDAQRAGG
jgi:hypothetical protein